MQTNSEETFERLGFLWFRASVTLASPLSPEDVHERLAKALPRFDLSTGRRVPHIDFSFPTTFSGWVRDGSFMICGPRKFKETNRLAVKGSIEGSREGSLIYLMAYNGQAIFVALLLWTIGIILGVCIAIVPEFRSLVGALVVVVVFGVLGAMFYLFVSLLARTDLDQLVACLQEIFTAERTH